MELEFPEKLNLAKLPTPIQKLSRLSEFFGGPTLYMKRDDLTGIGLSGNKIRKLEFTLYEALRGGADTVITCGGIGSNHARATAVAARQLGLTPVLVLRGKPGRYPDGNLLLNSLLGAELKFISREDYSESRDAVMDDLAAQWEKRGHHAYVIPEGASNAVGAWGYANAFLEMHRQLSEKKLKIDAVVCAVGSGGTQAGLLIGAETAHWEGEILGINVCDDAAFFKERIGGILNAFRRKYKAPLQISEDDIHLIDGYVGRGYALSRPEELQVIKDAAKLEGIFLDPTYTGKAMFGLMDQIKQGRFRKGQNILFIHTGGIYGLFPKRQMCFGGPDSPEFPDVDPF